MWLITNFVNGLIDVVTGALPLIAVVASIALAVGAVFAPLMRLPMLAGSLVLALFASFMFGVSYTRSNSKEAMLRIELANKTLDLQAAENSVKFWTDQMKDQESENSKLEQKVRDYENELAQPDPEPTKPVAGVCPNRCNINQRDIDRLLNIGR